MTSGLRWRISPKSLVLSPSFRYILVNKKWNLEFSELLLIQSQLQQFLPRASQYCYSKSSTLILVFSRFRSWIISLHILFLFVLCVGNFINNFTKTLLEKHAEKWPALNSCLGADHWGESLSHEMLSVLPPHVHARLQTLLKVMNSHCQIFCSVRQSSPI